MRRDLLDAFELCEDDLSIILGAAYDVLTPPSRVQLHIRNSPAVSPLTKSAASAVSSRSLMVVTCPL